MNDKVLYCQSCTVGMGRKGCPDCDKLNAGGIPQSAPIGALQDAVSETFVEHFGHTPFQQRLDDIRGECDELRRWTDLCNAKEELGDLIASCVQMANECEWDVGELVAATLDKIERRASQYHSLGRKVKVALYGGAFDPVTTGHVKTAQLVLDASGTFDEVWMVPPFSHMNNKDMAGAEHRLAMIEIAAQCDGRIKGWNYEVEKSLSGQTYQFVKMVLGEQFAKDQYDFSYMIGQDNANTFDRWVDYRHLERMIRFIVVPRLGVEPDPKVDWYRKEPHIYIAGEQPPPEVSSTEVRDMIAADEDPGWRLPSGVYDYIRENGLYGARK